MRGRPFGCGRRMTTKRMMHTEHEAHNYKRYSIFPFLPRFFWERARGLDVEMLGGGLKHFIFFKSTRLVVTAIEGRHS